MAEHLSPTWPAQTGVQKWRDVPQFAKDSLKNTKARRKQVQSAWTDLLQKMEQFSQPGQFPDPTLSMQRTWNDRTQLNAEQKDPKNCQRLPERIKTDVGVPRPCPTASLSFWLGLHLNQINPRCPYQQISRATCDDSCRNQTYQRTINARLNLLTDFPLISPQPLQQHKAPVKFMGGQSGFGDQLYLLALQKWEQEIKFFESFKSFGHSPGDKGKFNPSDQLEWLLICSSLGNSSRKKIISAFLALDYG